MCIDNICPSLTQAIYTKTADVNTACVSKHTGPNIYSLTVGVPTHEDITFAVLGAADSPDEEEQNLFPYRHYREETLAEVEAVLGVLKDVDASNWGLDESDAEVLQVIKARLVFQLEQCLQQKSSLGLLLGCVAVRQEKTRNEEVTYSERHGILCVTLCLLLVIVSV